MKIAIAGGTGFVGKALTKALRSFGHDVIILSRTKRQAADVRYVQWLNNDNIAAELNGIDALINLAGASINNRWTDSYKKLILSSRIDATTACLHVIEQLETKPRVFINASAIGIYGLSEHETFTEESTTVGHDFLAQVVHQWEAVAKRAESLNVRTVLTRFGVILGKDEGALPKMVLPYQLFAGGPLGSGRQWLSWVHIDDVVGAILFALEHEDVTGAINVTAPTPMRMNDFGKVLGRVLHRPHWLPTPSFALKLALGEMSVLVLDGQHVAPKKLLQSGYRFMYQDLEPALKQIFA